MGEEEEEKGRNSGEGDEMERPQRKSTWRTLNKCEILKIINFASRESSCESGGGGGEAAVAAASAPLAPSPSRAY